MTVDTLSPVRRELLGALFALSEAIQGKEYMITPETEPLIREALCADGTQAAALLPRVRAEKDRFAPDCRVCTHPCGRTAEFDFETLRSVKPEIIQTKLWLSERLKTLAESGAELSLLTDGLRIIGEDYPPEALNIVIKQFEE